MDVAAWLRGLGLQQYEQAFRDNAIDAEVLPELTDADLEKLGMLLGHRKRFRKAVVGLGRRQAIPTRAPMNRSSEPHAGSQARSVDS